MMSDLEGLKTLAKERIKKTCPTHGTECRHHVVRVAPEKLLLLLDEIERLREQRDKARQNAKRWRDTGTALGGMEKQAHLLPWEQPE